MEEQLSAHRWGFSPQWPRLRATAPDPVSFFCPQGSGIGDEQWGMM